MFSADAVRNTKLNRVVGHAIRNLLLFGLASCIFCGNARAADTELSNKALRVVISPADGSYAVYSGSRTAPFIRAGVAAEVDHRWLRSAEYPRHEVVSDFDDSLGHGRQAKVTFSGLTNRPHLICTIRGVDFGHR